MVLNLIATIVLPIVIAVITSILTTRTDKKKIKNLEQIVSNSKEHIVKLEQMLSKSDVQILELRNSINIQSQQLTQLNGMFSQQIDSDVTNIEMEIIRLNQKEIDTNAEIDTENRLKDMSIFPVDFGSRRYDENHLRQLLIKRDSIQNDKKALQLKLNNLQKGGNA